MLTPPPVEGQQNVRLRLMISFVFLFSCRNVRIVNPKRFILEIANEKIVDEPFFGEDRLVMLLTCSVGEGRETASISWNVLCFVGQKDWGCTGYI